MSATPSRSSAIRDGFQLRAAPSLNSATLISIQVGKVQPLGPNKVPSGFVKTAVSGAIEISRSGLPGDEQADLTCHGDLAKAVYAYPLANYAIWRASHPQHAALWGPGGVGENLTIAGPDEDSTCIGDIVRIGTATLQVTQPREPCYKFALRFQDKLILKAMIANGRTGWYFRVLTPGSAAPGDSVSLVDRINPAWPITRMNQFIHAKNRSPAEAAELAIVPGLAETWPRRLLKYRGLT